MLFTQSNVTVSGYQKQGEQTQWTTVHLNTVEAGEEMLYYLATVKIDKYEIPIDMTCIIV